MLKDAVLAASSISEEEHEIQGKALARYETRVVSTWSSLAKMLTSLNQAASKSLLNASTTTTAASLRTTGARQFDVCMLRLLLLTPEHAPADFRTWKEEFASFFAGYGM